MNGPGNDGGARSPLDGGRATATVLVVALADVGLQRLVGDQRAFINVDREFLMAFRPLPLPPDRVVLELVEDQRIDRLREHGIEIIAEKVETGEELEQCRQLGIARFQGFFFERPELVSGRPTPTLRLGASPTCSRPRTTTSTRSRR